MTQSESMDKLNELVLVAAPRLPSTKCTASALNETSDTQLQPIETAAAAASNDNDNNNETKITNVFETTETLVPPNDEESLPKQTTKLEEVENSTLAVPNNTNTSASSTAAAACPFASHHYHYIDYPAAYYQRKSRQNAIVAAAMSQNINSNAYHYCACSCPCESHMQILRQHQQPQQRQRQRQQHIAADVVVHQQSAEANEQLAFRTRSEQSLNNSHSYQVLNVLPEKNISSSCRSKLNINSTCNILECNCSAQQQQSLQKQRSSKKSKNTIDGTLTESMLATADEITVSESDNNGSMTKRKNMRESRVHKKINSWYEKNYNCNHIEIYSDGDEVDLNHQSDAILVDDAPTANILDQRPPLPPRPQPPPSPHNPNNTINAHRPGSHSVKKYVIWCLICGGFSCLLGALFLGVYFLLHSYTITVGNFETVPTFVPATLLILTGVCIMSLARRRNRYSYLIKLSGACGLISALTCALVTVTTTVLHMSRLQALRECEYAQKTRTCTCYSDMIESQVDRVDKEGVRLVFDSLSDCGVVHGSLYSCLRAIFGLSVAGVLTSVFSCMLVYQLLSHERKKMYWEQLELRCRSLYSTHQNQHQQQQHTTQAGPVPPHAIANTIASINARSTVCRCCEQCHAHRQLQLQAATYPWVEDVGEPRFWAGHPPGNFYSPNPCGGSGVGGNGVDDNNLHNHVNANSRNNRLTTGWSWPRMPWQRNTSGSNNRFRQVPSSPDSQYGFSSANASLNMAASANVPMAAQAVDDEATAAAMAAVAATQRAAQVFNMTANSNLPYGVWGPPPPYSDPNSPARRGFYQYMQAPNICQSTNRIVDTNAVGIGSVRDEVLQHRPLSAGALNTLGTESTPNAVHCVSQRAFEHLQQLCAVGQIENVYKTKDQNGAVVTALSNDYGAANSCTDDSDMDYSADRRGERFMNTLPTRKIKKRVIEGSGSIAKCTAPNSRQQQLPTAAHRINVQRIFPGSSNSTSENDADSNGNPRMPSSSCSVIKSTSANNNNENRTTMQAGKHRMHQKMLISDVVGVENSAFLNNGECDSQQVNGGACGNDMAEPELLSCDGPYEDPTESEIYFADVSSCCNMSMKNGNCYEDTNRQATQQKITHDHTQFQRSTPKCNSNPQQQQHFHQHQHSNCSQSSNASCCTGREEQRENSQRGARHHQQIQQQRQDESYNNKKKQNFITSRNSNHINNDALTTRLDNNKIDINSTMQKDASMQSMCSIETVETDLSPITPCGNSNSNNNNNNNNSVNNTSILNTKNLTNFIASFPETKFHEAQRRFSKTTTSTTTSSSSTTGNVQQDPHYEVINDGIKTSSMSPQPQCQRARLNFNGNNGNLEGQGSLGRRNFPRNMETTKEHLNQHRSNDGGGGVNRHRQRM